MSGSPAIDSSLSGRGGESAVSEASESIARCQSPAPYYGSSSAPWAGDPRAADKDNLCRLICENPDGVPLRRLASLISDGPEGEYSDRNYKFVSRFAKGSDHFRTIDKSAEITYKGSSYARFGKSLWVEPRASAFTCLRRKHDVSNPPKPQEGTAAESRVGVNAPSELRKPSKFAKERARSYLNRHTQIGSDSVRGSLAAELATELRSIEGRVAILERTSARSDLPEHLLIPYTTRFNDPSRAGESRERFDAVWSKAAARHDSAVMTTLTTDPSIHGSAIEAANALTDTLQSLRRWLSRSVSAAWAPRRVGRKLPYISALEWTESGLPHLHVVFFGARSLCSQGALSDYLADKTGRVVWFDSLTSRSPGGRWRWSNPSDRPSDAAAAETPRTYLSHALRSQQRLASMDAAEFTEHVERGEVVASGLWKQALYWASGKQLWTASESLQSPREDRRVVDRGLPAVPQYRYVGTSYYADLPGSIKRGGVLLGRPPPD